MTSAETSVTREGMEAAAARMEQTLRIVRSERDQVEASIASLFGTFSGSAATTYRRAMSGWFANVQEIEAALGEMVRIMRDGAQVVGKSDADTESDAAQGLAQMAVHSGEAQLPGL
ncbi:WXG100 family type VII secretion target [Lentzea alba]|uniref:WXG100 family type VII secretion target n=1 Tax=Lentzea alba TaxID=2714351 RepID=UPI0039BED954